MSYDLSQAAEELREGSSGRFSIFGEGVKSKYVKAWNSDAYIRFLPAYDANKTPTGYTPCHTVDNRLAPFLRIVAVWDQIGHGDFKNRRRFVSNKSWGRDEYDPMEELQNFIRANGCWSYLHQSPGPEPGNPNRKIQPPISKKPKMIAIANIVDVYNQAEGMFLGEFSSSVFTSMNSANGVLNAVNTMVSEEQIAQNYLWRYANGDITDPVYGPVLRVGKSPDAKGYSVSVALDRSHQVLRYDVTSMLPSRYDLEDLDSIIPRKDEAEIIQILLDTLNQRSPSGMHEWEMLKAVFGSRHNIPEAPSMTGQPNPVAPPAQQGFGPNPAMAPGMQAPAAPPAGMPPAPMAGQQQQVPGLPPAPPAPQPMQPAPQPMQPQAPQSQAPMQPQAPAPQPQMAPPASPAGAGAGQPIPGAPPASDDRASFMNKILNKTQ